MSERDLDARTVAVLGLGVIGGSLTRALARAAPVVRRVGWSPSLGERTEALADGAITEAPSAWEEAVEEADLIVLALPLEPCLRVLADLEGLTRPSATLTDVASLKAPVQREAVQAGVAGRWVGSHPMAGSEGSGFVHARADLFEGARVWMTSAGATIEHEHRVRTLWRLVGAEPALVDAEEHDRMMALVSHLPQLVSNALAAELAAREIPEERLGPGGRDMTRLAASSPEMWMDLLRHAPPELADGLRGVARTLEQAAATLSAGEIEPLDQLMKTTRAWRGAP